MAPKEQPRKREGGVGADGAVGVQGGDNASDGARKRRARSEDGSDTDVEEAAEGVQSRRQSHAPPKRKLQKHLSAVEESSIENLDAIKGPAATEAAEVDSMRSTDGAGEIQTNSKGGKSEDAIAARKKLHAALLQKYPAFIYNMCLGYTRTRTTQVRVKGEERIKNLLLEGTTPLSSLTTAALIDSIPKKTIQQMRAVPSINRAMPPPTSSSTRKPTRQAETSKGDTGADGEAPRKRGRPRKGESPKMADKNKAKAVTKKYTAPQGYTEREQEVMSKLEELQIPVVNDLQYAPDAGVKFFAGATPDVHGLPPRVCENLALGMSAASGMRQVATRSADTVLNAVGVEQRLRTEADGLDALSQKLSASVINMVAFIRKTTFDDYVRQTAVIEMLDGYTATIYDLGGESSGGHSLQRGELVSKMKVVMEEEDDDVDMIDDGDEEDEEDEEDDEDDEDTEQNYDTEFDDEEDEGGFGAGEGDGKPDDEDDEDDAGDEDDGAGEQGEEGDDDEEGDDSAQLDHDGEDAGGEDGEGDGGDPWEGLDQEERSLYEEMEREARDAELGELDDDDEQDDRAEVDELDDSDFE